MLEDLKQEVYEANMRLYHQGLVILTWGNVSGRQGDYIVIKPSGVSYETMKPSDMVVVNLFGEIVEGALNPSSDMSTHLGIYRACAKIKGICHTHSKYATSFAQAGLSIKAMGTTHADYFYGDVPCTRALTEEETQSNYEINTGRVIVETFQNKSWEETPAVLVRQHGPFTWGRSAAKAVENAIVLDEVACMNYQTALLNSSAEKLPQYALDKHYFRKHGVNAYYGQK